VTQEPGSSSDDAVSDEEVEHRSRAPSMGGDAQKPKDWIVEYQAVELFKYSFNGTNLDKSMAEGTVTVSVKPTQEMASTIMEEEKDDDDEEEQRSHICAFQCTMSSPHEFTANVNRKVGSRLKVDGHVFECSIISSMREMLNTPLPFIKYKIQRTINSPLKVLFKRVVKDNNALYSLQVLSNPAMKSPLQDFVLTLEFSGPISEGDVKTKPLAASVTSRSIRWALSEKPPESKLVFQVRTTPACFPNPVAHVAAAFVGSNAGDPPHGCPEAPSRCRVHRAPPLVGP
jgi:hypothetical protein